MLASNRSGGLTAYVHRFSIRESAFSRDSGATPDSRDVDF